MTNILYYLILIILVADFVFERWLEYLNTTKWSNSLPEQLKSIYNEEKYRLSQDYERTKYRFSKLTESLGFLIVLALFAGGAFGDYWICFNPVFIAIFILWYIRD
jgi:STE24 endopeptidase